jgi:hypothetical protein
MVLRELDADTGSVSTPPVALRRPYLFPNTATVETDFSITVWEKDNCRADLTDFSLEGILHCKHFKTQQALSYDLYMYEETRSG